MKGITVFILFILIAVATPAHADNALDKLARGFFNIIVSPMELFQAHDDHNDSDPAIGFTLGWIHGILNTGKRAAVGLFEVITWWIPIPEGYEPIIPEPIFLAEKRLKEEEAKAKKALKERQDDTTEAQDATTEAQDDTTEAQ